jgi:hypothetical protein
MDQIFNGNLPQLSLGDGAQKVFEKIKAHTDVQEFKDGLSGYLVSSYYKYWTKKKGYTAEEVKQLEAKLKIARDLLGDSSADIL